MVNIYVALFIPRNQFPRWMVRKDNGGVDFGIWKKLDPADPVKYDFAIFGLGVNEKF